MDTFQIILNVIIFVIILAVLFILSKKHVSFNIRVLGGLILGVVFGFILQKIYGLGSDVINETNNWIGIVGNGYVRLLKLTVIPLILVSITYAIINQKASSLKKMASLIIAVLLITVAIAAVIGGVTAKVFDLNPITVQTGDMEAARGAELEESLKGFEAKSIQDQIVEIIPTNPFFAMTGQGSSALLSVVFFASLLGIATLGIKKKHSESAELFIKFINALRDIVLRIVTLILRLTPYGVLAIMTRVLSTSSFKEIAKLGDFLLASYVAIAIMFIIHAVILAVFGLNPITYFRKALPALTFAFTSRTSAGTVPLTTTTLVEKMGLKDGYSNLAASLGTTIGQNGCAGIYPAMLAVMIAPTVGIDPLDPVWFIKLIIVTAISSIGIAGVGGGATFAALAVLSGMGLPVALVGVLISIEPLIDMARTALNVSDSMLSGVIAGKLDKSIDMDVYHSKSSDTVVS